MTQRFRFFDWCQTRQGGTAVLLVLGSGLLIGYFGWIALIAPPSPTFRLDFANARWIQASSEQGNNICFRKDIYLTEIPRYAWLQVTGVDGFKLFVNGQRAGISGKTAESDPTVFGLLVGGNESLICDITHYLVPGTNTIAINVTRGTFPGRAKLLGLGEIIESGKTTRFVSDRSWKVSLVPGTIPSLVSWTDPAMDDSSWAHAEEADSVERSNLIQPVPLPPVLLREPIKGKWIMDEQPRAANSATFRRVFDAPDGNSEAWLQIASNGTYSLILNGHFLGDFSDPAPTIQFLYLKRWIKTKANDLLIQVQTTDSSPAIISEISFLSDGARAASIVSDHDWLLPNSRLPTIIGAYNYSGDRWGLPPKLITPANLSSIEATRQQILGILFMLAFAAAVLLAWRWSSRLISTGDRWEIDRALGIDAALHLPALVAATTLLLLRFDVRLRPESPVSVPFFIGLIALLILPRIFAFFWVKRREPSRSVLMVEGGRGWANRYGFWIALGAIVLGSFVIRLQGLTTFPLDQDDILIRNYAQGIFERGYPSLDFYDYVIPITTYELVPYPIAFSCLIFGWSDWAVLLPAVIFGTLTTLLVGLMGRNLFDWRTGLAAALIHAFNPLNVFWSQHCFHPSQDQFFALLTIWSFYLAIREPGKLDVKYFYGSCLGFVCTYLSWEGTGFLLPIMAGMLMLMYPGRWGWLRQPQLWVGLIVVGSIVLIELSWRKMAAPNFLFLGYGLAQLGGPQLYFLNPESMPFYYVTSFLVTEPHLPLTILSAAGVFFAWKNQAVRYCLIIFVGLLAAFSLCLPIYSVRYFYFYQFLLILTACGVFFTIWDRTRELITGLRPAEVVVGGSGVVALLLIFGIATETGFKIFRLADRPEPSLRYGIARQDTRSPAEFVASRLRPGDIVLANLTQAFYLYGYRMPDYALDTLLATRIIYLNRYGSYHHRFLGIPMVRNLRDMDNIFGKARRIWYVGGGPITVKRPELKDALDFIIQRAKIVYSTYHTRVYLWDGAVTLAQETVANPALPPQPNLAPEKPAPLDRIVDEYGDMEPDQPIFDPRVNPSNLYPQWTHQKVSEPDPAHKNAGPIVRPLQPPPKPEKPDSDE